MSMIHSPPFFFFLRRKGLERPPPRERGASQSTRNSSPLYAMTHRRFPWTLPSHITSFSRIPSSSMEVTEWDHGIDKTILQRLMLGDLRSEQAFSFSTSAIIKFRTGSQVRITPPMYVIVDEQSWEPITPAPLPLRLPTPHLSPAGKGMAASYVGQVSAHTKHHNSARTSYKDMSKPSLGLDLRFEQNYLKSIAPHVRFTTPASDENEKHRDVVHLQGQRLDIKWGRVIWITTRDQVLAPMFQGVVWWVPLSSVIRTGGVHFNFGRQRGTFSPWVQYFRSAFVPSSTHERPSRTGAGIAKLKSWLSSIIPQYAATSFRTK